MAMAREAHTFVSLPKFEFFLWDLSTNWSEVLTILWKDPIEEIHISIITQKCVKVCTSYAIAIHNSSMIHQMIFYVIFFYIELRRNPDVLSIIPMRLLCICWNG